MVELVVNSWRGFVLIELIAAMAILTIIFTLCSGYIGIFKSIKEENDERLLVLKVEDLLKYSKEYFLINNKEGKIRFLTSENSIAVLSEEKEIEEVSYSEDYEVYFLKGATRGELRISSEGILDSGSIVIDKEGKKKYIIAIRVGVDYINVKEE